MGAALAFSAHHAGFIARLYVPEASLRGHERLTLGWYPGILYDTKHLVKHGCKFGAVFVVATRSGDLSIVTDISSMKCKAQRLIVAFASSQGITSLGEFGEHLLRMQTRYLAPTAPLAADLMKALEGKGLRGQVDVFFPIYSTWTEYKDPGFEDCKPLEEHLGDAQKSSTSNTRELDVPDENGSLPRSQIAPVGCVQASAIERPISFLANHYQFRQSDGNQAVLLESVDGSYEEAAPGIKAAVMCATTLMLTRQTMQAFPFLIEEAVTIHEEGKVEEAFRVFAESSEGAKEAKVIAMEAVRSKLMLQNQLLMHSLGRRVSSIFDFVHCRV